MDSVSHVGCYEKIRLQLNSIYGFQDNIPLVDPAEHFESVEFKENRSVFWPDLNKDHRKCSDSVAQIIHGSCRNRPQLITQSGVSWGDRARMSTGPRKPVRFRQMCESDVRSCMAATSAKQVRSSTTREATMA